MTSYTYDGLNRPTQVGFGAHNGTYASTIGYLYDAGGRMTKATDSISGIVQRGYDGLNRLTSETSPQGSIAYTYDNASRRSTMQVTGQPQVNYTYDIANRLTQIAQGSNSVGFSYDITNRRASLTLPNGIVAAFGYDTDSRLTGITYTLNLNPVGNLTYTYDTLGRRVAMGGSLAGTGFPSAVSSAAYDVANELTNWAGAAIAYDADGNVANDGTNTYAWDARNQLNSLNSGASSFVYDPFGRRVTKTNASASTSFLYDGANTVQELSGTTATANLMTGGIDERFSRTDSSGARNFLTDALGSTLALVDSAGAVQTQYSYDPFGNTNLSGAGTTNNVAYTGRENDGDGLYFYRARYYSPQLGRFISEDPLGLSGGPNFYSYAGNDPISWIDPFGLADVYGWNYRGSTDAWGHSSMDINNGNTHISWWPQADGRDYTFGDSVPIYDAPAYPNQTLADDTAFESQGPDFVIHLDNLDESAIAAWWGSYRRNNKWKTFGRNCSTTVAHALEAGGGDRRVRGFPKPIVWTPEDVKQYALAIQAAGTGSYDYPVPHTGLNNK